MDIDPNSSARNMSLETKGCISHSEIEPLLLADEVADNIYLDNPLFTKAKYRKYSQELFDFLCVYEQYSGDSPEEKFLLYLLKALHEVKIPMTESEQEEEEEFREYLRAGRRAKNTQNTITQPNQQQP